MEKKTVNFTLRGFGRYIGPAFVVRCVSMCLALGVVAVLVIQHSASAFSGAESIASKLGSGTVTMTYAQATGTADNVPDMYPGEEVTRCVLVTYGGNADAERLDSVRYYGSYASGDKSLGPYVDYKVTVGTKGSTCSSFQTQSSESSTIDAFVRAKPDYARGSDTGWTPTGGDVSRPFRMTYSMPDTASNNAQGASAKLTNVWEVRSRASGTASR